jgi:hypothetical protein
MTPKEFKARMSGVTLNTEQFRDMQATLVAHTPPAMLQDHARREIVRAVSDQIDAGVIRGMLVVLATGRGLVVHHDFPEGEAQEVLDAISGESIK